MRALFSIILVMGSSAAAQEDPVSFTWARGKLLVPVYLNEVGPYTFLLDAGATEPAVDPSVAAYLKLPADPSGAARTALSRLQVGSFETAGQAAAVEDLSPLQGGTGVAVQGRLPVRLGAAPLAVDFPASTLAYGAVPERAYRHAAPLRSENGTLRVDVLLNGSTLRPATLDLSYGGVVAVSEELAAKLGLAPTDAPRLEFEPAPEGQAPLDGQVQVRLRSLALGGAEAVDVPCTLLETPHRLVIGTGFLKHFRALFDLEGGRLHLDSSKRLPVQSEPFNGYGLVLGDCRDGHWSVYVAVNGPAYTAGVKSGDRLVTVDGQSLKDVSYADAAARLVAEPEKKSKFTFQRGEESREVELVAATVF